MSSCARVADPRCLRRLAIGPQATVRNLPHTLKLTGRVDFQLYFTGSCTGALEAPLMVNTSG
jgi:hypothetical protein